MSYKPRQEGYNPYYLYHINSNVSLPLSKQEKQVTKFRLLIVDDSRVIRERMRIMLHDLNNVEVVGEASNYHEALTTVAALDPDIIIMDINMPGKNGLDLLLEIKLMQNPAICIMLSNYSDVYYRNLCEKMGADYFFDKSTEFERIPEVLNAFVRI